MNYLEFIVKDGTVTIPSIFMFEDFLDLEQFLNYAKKANCVVVFENESLKMPPQWENTDVRFLYYVYRSMIQNKNIGDAYVRYLSSPDKMSWDKVR